MKKQTTTTSALAFVSLIGILFLIGCGGVSQSPLAPAASPQKMADNSDSNPAYFVFSTRDLSPSQVLRAGKPSGKATSKKDVEKVSNKRGGILSVSFSPPANRPGDAVYLRTAIFTVERGSMGKDTEISMDVSSGITLEDVVVTFGPSGAKFNPPATLTLWVHGDIKTSLLKVYHIEVSGSARNVTNAQVKAVQIGDEWMLTIKVPGFSQYSVGDDWVPETTGAPGSGG